MDKKLNSEMFTKIFVDSLPNILNNLQFKAFNSCVNNFDLPFLNDEEKACVDYYSKKYLFTIDYTLIHFSKKVLE